MNNLTTRKVVLGLLMTLVLGFGVQGVLEAVEDPDIQSEQLNPEDVYTVGDRKEISITLTPDQAGTRETVSISKSSGIAFVDEYYSLSSIRLTEDENLELDPAENGTDFIYTVRNIDKTVSNASPIAIPYSFQAKGIQTITISGRDYEDPDAGSWSYRYTFYVKGPGSRTTTTRLVSLTDGLIAGDGNNIVVHHGDSSHYEVMYDMVPSGGSFQIETPRAKLTGLANNGKGSSAFDVLLKMDRTYQVNAKVTGSDVTTTSVYIIGYPNMTVGYPDNPDGLEADDLNNSVDGSRGSPGRINQVLKKAFYVRVTDGTLMPPKNAQSTELDGSVPGVVVTFRADDSGTGGGYVVFNAAQNAGTLVTSDNRVRVDAFGAPLTTDTAKVLYVRTLIHGNANVDFQLGTDRKQDVTISCLGQRRTVSAYAGEGAYGGQLVNPRSQSSQATGHAGEYELRVNVEDEDGAALSNKYVEFRTSDGTLEDPSMKEGTSTLGRLGVRTDTQGIALVFFDQKDTSGSPRVTAHLFDLGDGDTEGGSGDQADTVIDDVVFDIRGGGSTPNPQPNPQPTNTIFISPASTTGAPGNTMAVNVNSNPAGIFVTLRSNDFSNTNFSPQSGITPFTSALTLPSSTGVYQYFAYGSIGGVTVSDSEAITVETAAPGTLAFTLGTRVGNQQTITVSAARGGLAQSGVLFSVTGGASTYSGRTETNGSVSAIIALPTATNSHVLTVSATGYPSVQATALPPGQTTTTPTGPAGEADSIEIVGSRQLSGTLNQASRLRTQVLDANDTGVGDVAVTFKVLSPGQGTFAGALGNGRAVRLDTSQDGYATTSFTPTLATSGGTVTVEAKAAGVSAPVTFIISVDEASDTQTPTPPPDTDVSPPTETHPAAVVHVGAAHRPPMVWVDGGKIYALVGANVQEFASGVEGALNIAIGGEKVYWTEMTGESGGTINSANLDGSGATELKSIRAVPMGIAVDVPNSLLYWTNSRGRIQSLNADGSGIVENVVENLVSPMDIALADGAAYWTQGGNVRFVNLTGQKEIRNISTGMDSAGSLTIGGGKVYWTEMTGESGGTINSANLDGSGATELRSIRAVPIGIAVDAPNNKLYWTNSRGRIQSMDVDGVTVENVVDGLGIPGDMVLSESISAPAASGSSTGSGTTADTSKYDVNGDGVVDGKDKALVLDAVVTGTYVAKYDVNDDKKLNILDYVLVEVNIDTGAAGAPALLGMKLSTIQIDRIEEQIDLLIATGDRSPAAMRTLIYLQQLIATARPEKTQLLANYPNPFNPETWMPYELATDTTVKITIYNTQGVVIRTLALGHQSAGYYVGRDRAAYWDGRNALGEQVASGIYFYQFETDTMSSMRKMVILK
ncbi:MAG: FlgD immunoglobulin-like domain containing protein [Parvularculales bacterium]